MSSPKSDRSKRRELLKKIWSLGRTTSTQTVFLHQAIAQSVALNATDTRCIDLILSQPDCSMTAGSLSGMTGLTTGAITHILDRLERRQFIERVRDSRDRRKVFVRVRPESLEPLIPMYEGIGKAYMNLIERYSDDQLAVICDYFERASDVSKRELANLVAANASQTPRKSTSSRRGRGRFQ